MKTYFTISDDLTRVVMQNRIFFISNRLSENYFCSCDFPLPNSFCFLKWLNIPFRQGNMLLFESVLVRFCINFLCSSVFPFSTSTPTLLYVLYDSTSHSMHGTKACILIRRLLILLEIELRCVGQFDDEQDYVCALMT